MRSINKVILIGNLTRDPEIRQTPNGQSVCTFGLATNREWVTKEGEKRSSAEFHECVAWAHLAEICENKLSKGKLVYVEGYLKTRNWESPEGVKKFKTEVVIQDMIILEKRNQSSNRSENEEIEDSSSQEDQISEPDSSTESPEPEAEADKSELSTEEESETSENKQDEDPIDKDLGL